MVSKKPTSFIGQSVPPGYQAGVGRGATSFTTRSDIGPARDVNDVPDERHRHVSFKKSNEAEPVQEVVDEELEEDLNDTNYDEFSGYGGSLFRYIITSVLRLKERVILSLSLYIYISLYISISIYI